MRISTSRFHMRETVAFEITVDTPFADTIMLKDTLDTGRNVLNAEKILKRKCMFTMGQMNTILKSWKIHQTMNQLNAKCGVVIKLGAEGFTQSGDEYWCEACGARELEKMMRRTKASSRSPKGRG